MDVEHFSYIEAAYRSEFPLQHYGFVVARTFGTAIVAIITNILLYYLLMYIRKLFKKFLVLEDAIFWVDWAIFIVNVSVTAAVSLMLESRMRRYWSREVLLKFAAERDNLFPKEEL